MTEPNPTVVVTADETLSDIVARLREAADGGRTVDLVVPIDSALLLTAREFRALKDAIDEDRVAVRMRTADPLRLQLAGRLGIPAGALPRPRVVAAPAVIATEPPEIVAEAPAVRSEDWPGETAVAEPVLRPAPESHWPSQNGLSGESDDAGSDGEPVPEVDQERGPANPPRRWLPVAAALLGLVIVALFGIRFVLPQAVVTIVPRTAPVSAAIVFDVTADGRPIDEQAAFAVTPQQRQVEVVWEGSAPVTGVRVEPDGTAHGAIELRNASPEPLTVEAGTTVATETGVEFAFTETVTVPAADPATGRPGAATGTVQAVKAGSGGNVGTGEIGGRLPNGVYYSNRMQPAVGGSDKEFPVVAQEDLDALRAAANSAAPGLAAEVITQDQPGEEILLSTAAVSEQDDAFDRQVGDDAAAISLRSTLTVDVLTFDGDVARAKYEQILADRLGADAPQGFVVTPDDIVFEGPIETREGDRGVRLEVKARAAAIADLDDAERAALADELVGASAEDAVEILARRPEIAEYRVDYHPAWLPEQMPNNAGRIQLEIAR
jgi:Baseplate J-like protein